MIDLTETLIDPQDKYYSEGFSEQSQPWPGLQRDMNTMPNCGEGAYEDTRHGEAPTRSMRS